MSFSLRGSDTVPLSSPPITPTGTGTGATFTQRYNLGPVLPVTAAAANILGPMFNIKTIYGWRQSDPFPDHPSGHALDFMIPNTDTGNRLAAYAQANAGALGVKYIIWNRQYWQPSQGTAWVPYTQTSNPHTDHVHITFLDSTNGGTVTNNGAAGGTAATDPNATGPAPDTCAWNLAAPTFATHNPIPGLPDVLQPPDVKFGGQSFCLLSKEQVRVMFGISIMATGIMIGLVGTVLLVVYGLAKSGTGNAVLSAVPGGSVVRKFL